MPAQTASRRALGEGDHRAAAGEDVEQRVDAADVVEHQEGERAVRPRLPTCGNWPSRGKVVQRRLDPAGRAGRQQNQPRLAQVESASKGGPKGERERGRGTGLSCQALSRSNWKSQSACAISRQQSARRRPAWSAERRCCGWPPGPTAAWPCRARSRRAERRRPPVRSPVGRAPPATQERGPTNRHRCRGVPAKRVGNLLPNWPRRSQSHSWFIGAGSPPLTIIQRRPLSATSAGAARRSSPLSPSGGAESSVWRKGSRRVKDE